MQKAVSDHVPVIVVMVHGASMDISEVLESADAVLDAFYPGQFGATAIAETLFGQNVCDAT